MCGESAKKKKGERRDGVLATNRKALHDFAILSTLEVGIVLKGTEVKVVREGGVGLVGSYVQAEGTSLWLLQANFPPYDFGNRFNHDSQRPRRLLAHKREILKLRAQQEQKGLTLVPLKMYLAPNKRVKLQIGIARGKNVVDKRETLRRRDADRSARREMAAAVRR